MSKEKRISFEQRLKDYPYLQAKVLDRADAAEERVIEELREMGKEVLQDWALCKEKYKTKEFKTNNQKSKNKGKKKSIGIRPMVK